MATLGAGPTDTALAHHVLADKNRRGINVYTMSEIMGASGRNKYGEMVNVQYQRPIFYLNPIEREELVRLNSFLLGIVSARMNKISNLDWSVKKKKDQEDVIVERLKAFRNIFREYEEKDLKSSIVRNRVYSEVKKELVDIKVDLSNFDSALIRWKKAIELKNKASCAQVEDWINGINSEDDFEEFKKKWVFDLMVQGSASIYKQVIDEKLENCYILPGGSVYPIRSRYVGSATGYIQMMYNIDPKIYFSDEIIFDAYLPVSAKSYGLIPLEALINKVSESLLFDKLAAERADGTKPPEKLIIFGENQSKMFGDLNTANGLNVPLNYQTQNRIETIVNEERKNAVRVISGTGTPMVADISKADTFSVQSDRQSKLIRDIGFVFNASPFEMSLAGSEFVAGRETAKEQANQEREKGIYPIVRIINKTVTRKIIPFKFGGGFIFDHKTGLTEMEQVELDAKKISSGTYDVNEIRESRGDDIYDDEIYNRPPGFQQGQIGGNDINPLFVRRLDG